ncbi:MAG: ABC transporter transmembrane domain-containing protein, partial [Planctomycetota bacterium]
MTSAELTSGGSESEDSPPFGREAGIRRTLVQLARLLGQEPGPPVIEGIALEIESLAIQEADDWALLEKSAAAGNLRISRRSVPGVEFLWTTTADSPAVVRLPVGGWLIAHGLRRHFEIWRSDRGESAKVSSKELSALLEISEGEELQIGIVQLLSPSVASSHEIGEKPTPGRRLLELFKPDRREIRMVVLFSVVVGLLNLATPIAVETLVNFVAFAGLLQPILVLSLALLVCLGLAGVFTALEAFVVELIQRRVFARIAIDLAWRLPRVPVDAWGKSYAPELVNRFFDLQTLQKVGAKLLLNGVTAALSAIIGLIVLAFYHPLLLALDAMLILALTVILFVLGRRAVQTAKAESSAKYEVVDWLEELVRHPVAFRTPESQSKAHERAEGLTVRYLENRARHFRIVFRQLSAALVLQAITGTVLLGLGGWLVKAGQLTLGQLVASWLIVSLVLTAITKLGSQLESVYDLCVGADKIGVLLDLPVEARSGVHRRDVVGPAALTAEKLRLPGVGRAIDIDLRPGGRLAIIGGAGVGKSRVLDGLAGLRTPVDGVLELDGIDVGSLPIDDLRHET